MRTVLVAGATGRVGGQVAAQLAGSGTRVRVLARDPARALARFGEGVEVVGGDLDEPGTAAREVVATLTAHAPRVVYLSAHGVPEEPDGHAEPDGSILGSHAYVEGLIASSPADSTILRSSGFAANTLGWAEQIRRSDVLRWFHPEARRALVHEADLGAVAVRVLTEDGHNGRVYHLTGAEQLTQVQQLHAIGDALGRSLRFEEIDAAGAAELLPGMPADMVASIAEGHAAFVAHPEPLTDTVEQLTRHPALPFAQWARDHAADFAGPAR